KALDRSHHQCPPARQRSRTVVALNSRSRNGAPGRTLIRKTSLLRIVPTACGQAADIALAQFTSAWRLSPPCHANRVQCSEIAYRSRRHVMIESRSDPTSSRCQISRTRTCDARLLQAGLTACAEIVLCERAKPPALVEPDGIEPTTSCLQSRRSPN